MIVTIDGPAGAGKSSTARRLAERLDFRFLDTGALYRAAALAALRAGIDWEQEEELVEFVAGQTIEWTGQRVLLNGEDVSDAIRSPEVTECVHFVADPPPVRSVLVEVQRTMGEACNLVTEGRDQGTVVFPHAECKIFLTASPEERARRRAREEEARGQPVDWQAVLSQQEDRDRRDATRPVGSLKKADDAIEVVTDGMNEDEVVSRLERLVRERCEDT